MAIKAILFDVIGTTVLEKKSMLIHKCFESAFDEHKILVSSDDIRSIRGRDKREAISNILKLYNSPTHLCDSILHTFKKYFENELKNFSEPEGLEEIIFFLKKEKVKVGIGTGLPGDMFQLIYNYLSWNRFEFDYTGAAENIGRGRPHPDMIYDMMKHLNIKSSEFLKIGDTVADIHEGKNAQVFTAANLSGTAIESEIITAKPDFIITSLLEIKNIYYTIK